MYDGQGGRHQAFYSPKRDMVVLGEVVKAHERIQVEQSFKYSQEDCDALWKSAGVLEADKWMTGDKTYGKLLHTPMTALPCTTPSWLGKDTWGLSSLCRRRFRE